MTSKSINTTLVIKSKQILNGETTQTDVEYDCTLYNLNGKVTIFYDESKNGMGDTKSSLQYAGGTLTLKRKGAYNSNMVFAEDEHTSFAYRTPYGIIPMEIYTKILNVVNGSRFKAHIEYDLSNSNEISENIIDIFTK